MVTRSTNRYSDRIAAAPISWGVCEVPGWGFQLTPERVFEETSRLGLTATEFGPVGFLPADPAASVSELSRHGLHAIGGFLPVVLHDAESDPLVEVDEYLDRCQATGASILVLAASTGLDGYDERIELTDTQWQTLLQNLDRIDRRAGERGVVATIHPHIGTLIETSAHVDRIVAGSGIGLCVDTGHLVAAGSDPVAVVAAHVNRVRHVHLKDVDSELGPQVAGGHLDFSEAITRGLFTRLGEGAVDVRTIIQTLESAHYAGWYVLEQDIKLAGPPTGAQPYQDIEACLNYVSRELSAADAH